MGEFVADDDASAIGQAGLILTAASGAYPYTGLGSDVATAEALEALGFAFSNAAQGGCSTDVLHSADQDSDGYEYYGYKLTCSRRSGAYDYAITGSIDSGDRWDNDANDTSFWVVPSALSPNPLQVTMVDPNTPGRVAGGAVVLNLSAPTTPSASFEYPAFRMLAMGFVGTDGAQKVAGIGPDSSFSSFYVNHFRYAADDAQDPWLGGTVTPLSNVLYKWTYGVNGSAPLQVDFNLESIPGNPLHWSRACASTQGRYGFDGGGVRFVATDGTLLATAQFNGCGRPAVTLY